MHEFAIADDIVTTIINKVYPDLTKIQVINLEVGTLSGVVVDSLDFGLSAILEEKNAPGIKVNITTTPTQARCQCGKEYEIKEILDSCPQCESMYREIISGKDVIINSIEVNEE
jgi:hydrogenase nickel incorporation protein HypA/HybF